MTSTVPAIAQLVWDPDANFIVQITVAERSHTVALKNQNISHPGYCSVPRQCFLLTHARSIASSFSTVVAKDSPMWLEYQEGGAAQPIVVPCQFPIGVIVDILAALKGQSTAAFLKAEINSALKFKAKFSVEEREGEQWALPVFPSEIDGAQLITHRFKQYLQLVYRDLHTVFTKTAPQLEEQRKRCALGSDGVEFYKMRKEYLRNISALVGEAEFTASQNLVAFYIHTVTNRSYASSIKLINAMEDPTLLDVLNYNVECCYGIANHVPHPNCTLHGADIPVDQRFYVSILGVTPILSTETKFLREQLCAVDFFVHIVISPVSAETRITGRERPTRVAVATDKQQQCVVVDEPTLSMTASVAPTAADAAEPMPSNASRVAPPPQPPTAATPPAAAAAARLEAVPSPSAAPVIPPAAGLPDGAAQAPVADVPPAASTGPRDAAGEKGSPQRANDDGPPRRTVEVNHNEI